MPNQIKVQFCCGSNRLDGWKNHDQDVDVTKPPLPYDDNSVDFILIEHGLEHFDCSQGLKFLDECHRILRSGGVLRVCVPILNRITDLDHRRDLCLNHGHKNLYTAESLEQMLECAQFYKMEITDRKACDGHFSVIGLPKDTLETLRMEAWKT